MNIVACNSRGLSNGKSEGSRNHGLELELVSEKDSELLLGIDTIFCNGSTCSIYGKVESTSGFGDSSIDVFCAGNNGVEFKSRKALNRS